MKVPHLPAALITVQLYKAKGVLPDLDASQPATKPAIDGLIDAGVLKDDSGEYLKGLLYLPPLKGPDALELTVTEVTG